MGPNLPMPNRGATVTSSAKQRIIRYQINRLNLNQTLAPGGTALLNLIQLV